MNMWEAERNHALEAQCFQPACIAGKHFGKPSSELPRLAAWKAALPGRPFSAGPTAHTLSQVAKAVAGGIDRPDDVVQRIHQAARQLGNQYERFCDTQVLAEPLMDHFTQHGNLREARPDVVVQVSGNARPHAFEF